MPSSAGWLSVGEVGDAVSLAAFIACQKVSHRVPYAVCRRALCVGQSWFWKWHHLPPTAPQPAGSGRSPQPRPGGQPRRQRGRRPFRQDVHRPQRMDIDKQHPQEPPRSARRSANSSTPSTRGAVVTAGRAARAAARRP